MADDNTLMRWLLSQQDVIGSMEETEARIEPLPEQLALGPGDYALVATSTTQMEKDLVVVELMQPDQYQALFPDWNERMLKNFVPVFWRSVLDPEGEAGWYSRMRLLPIEKEKYDEIVAWLDERHLPNNLPDWIQTSFEEYAEAIHGQSPSNIPALVRCGKCESPRVDLHASILVTVKARAGNKVVNDTPQFIAVQSKSMDKEILAHLHCSECGWYEPLNEDQYDLGIISGFMSGDGHLHD